MFSYISYKEQGFLLLLSLEKNKKKDTVDNIYI